MALSNYTELRDSIIKWADNDDVTPRVDDFISLAHTRLNRILRLESMVCFGYVSCVPGDQWLAKPDGYLGMRRFKINDYPTTALRLTPFTEIDEVPAANTQGRPVAYAVAGDRFRLAPVPNAAFEVELIYYERQPTLSAAVPTNDFLLEASDLLLYGSLLEAEPYLKDNEMFGIWQTQFSRALDDLDISNERQRFPNGDVVMRAV